MYEERVKVIEQNIEEMLKKIKNLIEKCKKDYIDNLTERSLIVDARNRYSDQCRQLEQRNQELQKAYEELKTKLEKKEEKEFQGYFTIRQFNEKYDITMPSERASVIGKQATKLSQEKRVEIKKVPDWQYGEVNSYREDVLLFIYAEEIKKSTNKLFGREKLILENYEKVINPLIVVSAASRLKEEKIKKPLLAFVYTYYFLSPKTSYILVEDFLKLYREKTRTILGRREIIGEMEKLGFEKTRKRVAGKKQQVFLGLVRIWK